MRPTLRESLGRYPALKAALKNVLRPFRTSTSDGYQLVSAERVEESALRLKDAWQDAQLPGRQRAGVERALATYRAGKPDPTFDVLVEMLRTICAGGDGAAPVRLLEVGCSSGYYSEVFAIRGLPLVYAGCDFSPAFVELARRHYPALEFRVADATMLPDADNSQDVVVSGCCLLHIPDYPAAIRESARVARRHVIFHRTPVLHQGGTRHFTKRAYGVETIEIHFNEQELVNRFTQAGLRVSAIATLNVAWRHGDAYATKTYLCDKLAPP